MIVAIQETPPLLPLPGIRQRTLPLLGFVLQRLQTRRALVLDLRSSHDLRGFCDLRGSNGTEGGNVRVGGGEEGFQAFLWWEGGLGCAGRWGHALEDRKGQVVVFLEFEKYLSSMNL